jgi:thiopeptide-type bacteriocin biosynthesis protein
LSVDEWTAWSDGLRYRAGDGADARTAAIASDVAMLRRRLRQWVARPIVREALLVASPSLDASIERWLAATPDTPDPHMERALVRYLSRMCTRATPFGLFAGCTLSGIGASTRLVLDDPANHRRETRVDSAAAFSWLEELLRSGRVHDDLCFAPSSTIYTLAGRMRHIQVDRARRPWSFTLSALEPDEALAFVLRVAKSGMTRHELTKAVAAHADCDESEAAPFVDELIAQQVLEPALPLGLCGAELLSSVITAAAPEARAPLEQAMALTRRIDSEPVGAAVRLYRELADVVSSATKCSGDLVNVSLYKPGSAIVGQNVVADVVAAARVMFAVAGTRTHAQLDRFRRAFVSRFEGASMPLLEVLDDDVGIGFDATALDGGPLLEGLDFPSPVDATVAWSERESHLLRRIQETARVGAPSLELSDRDVALLTPAEPRGLPPSFAAHVTLLAPSADEVDSGRYRLLLGQLTTSRALGSIARFVGADDRIRSAAVAYAEAEQARRPHVTLADIAHVSDGAVGNLCVRPRLRSAEIPILAGQGVEGAETLALSDLRVSVDGERVVLRHVDGREIVPFMTSAHESYSQRSIGIYRFLRAVAEQDETWNASWEWGALNEAAFLPRVTYCRCILARARWRLGRDQLESLRRDSLVERMAAVDRLRQELALPRWILVEDYDRMLAVDLDNVLAVESFLQICAGRRRLVVVEMLPAPDELVVEGAGGRYAHELVIPFVSAPSSDGAVVAPSRRPQAHGADRFVPGSEWCSLKIYTGRAHADEVLVSVVKPIVDAARRSAAADRWFFIRYADPEPHLRLRLHGEPRRLYDEILPELLAAGEALVASGASSRSQLDTYVPELQRYGGRRAMPAVERIFCADSEMTLAWLERASEVAVPDGGARWRAALVGSQRLVEMLGIDRRAAARLFRRQADAYKREFRADGRLLRQLGQRYRALRPELEALLLAPAPSDQEPFVQVIREAAAQLRTLDAQGELTVALDELAASLLHMHANRLLPASPRQHELVVCEFLARFYESQLARAHRD